MGERSRHGRLHGRHHPGHRLFEISGRRHLKNTTHAELKQIALDSGSLPPLHEPVGFHFHGKKLVEEGTLKTYGVKRGDTIFVDVRREAFSLDKTGPPAFAGSDDDDEDDGARE